MAGAVIEAMFLPGAMHRLFCLLHRPSGDVKPRGAILYLAPFAEEMNKARRMVALQARALAEQGWWVLQADLSGCGDSEGDFGEASWDLWVDDAGRCLDWLRNVSGQAPMLWGLRAGCLVAAAVACSRPTVKRMLFWQPVVSGKLHLQQFLRLKVAGAMLAEGRAGGDGTRRLRERLQGGETIEIAGYLLPPGLAMGLEGATMAPPGGDGRIAWLEVSNSAAPELPLPSRQTIGNWEAAGWQVDATTVSGASFWQTQEIEEVPGLVDATLAALAGGDP